MNVDWSFHFEEHAKPPKTHHDLSEFCGILKKGEADEIRANMKCFDRIDKDMWK